MRFLSYRVLFYQWFFPCIMSFNREYQHKCLINAVTRVVCAWWCELLLIFSSFFWAVCLLCEPPTVFWALSYGATSRMLPVFIGCFCERLGFYAINSEKIPHVRHLIFVFTGYDVVLKMMIILFITVFTFPMRHFPIVPCPIPEQLVCVYLFSY